MFGDYLNLSYLCNRNDNESSSKGSNKNDN